MGSFVVKSPFEPTGDQPAAINALAEGIERGERSQVLLGVTGSGKTYTMAKVIERVQRPTLVLAHNKTLAAQLCSEFREFFPDSAVEYFVSYYDYYQPEAYIPSSDVYIEKTALINDEIDKMRHSATSALNERRDVIVVASVSCIYALGDPEEYMNMSVSLRPGMAIRRDELVRRLVDIQYERNDINFVRGTFRIRGDVLEIFPASHSERAIRLEFFGDEIERISEIDTLTGMPLRILDHFPVFPATHYATSPERMKSALGRIESDMHACAKSFEENSQPLEAERITQRTTFDLEMMQEIGFCSGIENYSRYFDGRLPGEPPYTLLDYFPKDFVLFIDESHVTIPQIRAMYKGDFARKDSLVKYGFRLPAAYDNRPLKFEEFNERLNQVIYVSATPAAYELEKAERVVEQIIRPTGLMDPVPEVRPAEGQIDDLVGEIRKTVDKGQRVLVTTLTKRMAERLTDYLDELDIRVRYMHSDIDTMERMEIIRDLRLGEFDVLVGINLLREGLDLPEVGFVAILDADKEGYLRSTTSLVQTIGRAARNVDSHVILYADKVTDSMQRAIDESVRRHDIQAAYNEANGIVPQSVVKDVRAVLEISRAVDEKEQRDIAGHLSPEQAAMRIKLMEEEMQQAAAELDFERAAKLRDAIFALREGRLPAGSAQKRKMAAKRKGKGRQNKR
ncbi:MAG: excinuclease ABC subunit UvrB [Clostridia bacterium]|nr:excinuclease ABC subunit UvrB [Clostridia bacterium]